MKNLMYIGLALAICMAAEGCRSKTALDAEGVPHTLVIGVYEGDNPGEMSKTQEPIRQYLEKKLGMPVELQKSTDYTTVIEALLTKKVHMAYLSALPYVLATQKQKLTPLVVLGINGVPHMYKSVILTNPGTGLKNMDDVKARAKSLTLCFADPASTSGHIIPRAYLNSIGLDPDKAFKQTMFAGSHYASVLTVKAGKVDLGCTFGLSLEKMIRAGMIRAEDVVVLWESDPIVGEPIVMRSDLSPVFAAKVKQAYLDMSVEAPKAFKDYVSQYLPSQADSLTYMPVYDSSYDGLRKIMAGTPDFMPTK